MKKTGIILVGLIMLFIFSGCRANPSNLPDKPNDTTPEAFAMQLDVLNSKSKQITLTVKESTANILECEVTDSDEYDDGTVISVVNYSRKYPREMPFTYDEIIVFYTESLNATIIPDKIIFTRESI